MVADSTSGLRRLVSGLPLLALCILLYVLAVTAFSAWSYREHKQALFAEIDSDLLQAARSLKYLLAPDFHDRAVTPDSIAMDEELRNRTLVTAFGVESGFKWVHTIAEYNGKFYFSAPSVSPEEAEELDSWYFYPYEDIPPEFVRALREMQTVFVTYTDQWGTFRSVALPQESPGGRRYLASADLEVSGIRQQLRKDLLQSIAVSVFFLVAFLPFIGVLIAHFRAHTADLRRLNRELQQHQDHLEDLVGQRTAALEKETRRLQEALTNVKTLRGLLPVCASCKKIRDDEGYWDQLESYILKNTDAEFTHGLCPDCLRRLYPEFIDSDDPPDPD